MEGWGDRRYYGLNGPLVAAAIEALALISPPVEARSLRGGYERGWEQVSARLDWAAAGIKSTIALPRTW
jgi:hypothetical protein